MEKSKGPDLRGALGRVSRRAAVTTEFNEFNEFGHESRPVSFSATRQVVPKLNHEAGTTVQLDISVRARYVTFMGDNDETCAILENNAMRSMCRCLYEDVLDDLLPVIEAVGAGQRRQALTLLNALFVRLNGLDN